jgi:hypothetical protein
MFGTEYLIRLRVLRDPPRHSLAAVWAMVSNPTGESGAEPLPVNAAAPD